MQLIFDGRGAQWEGGSDFPKVTCAYGRKLRMVSSTEFSNFKT